MTPVTPLDRFRQALDAARAAVADTLPPGRTEALLALLRAGKPAHTTRPGWNLALRFCLEGRDTGGTEPINASWTERFLADCDELALANLALVQCASGSVQMQEHGTDSAFVAWATSRRLSPEQRERADFDWWSAHVARQVAPRLSALHEQRAALVASDPTGERYYRALGEAHVARFACQQSYPADAAIGGATFGRYGEILGLLIGWLLHERDERPPERADTPVPRDERAIVAALADALDADPAAIRQALQPFIVDRENAAYHSALPGQAAPPLIRLDVERVVWSARGLLGEPLIFVARELRRRHAQEYHNSAHLREGVFRQDLYHLFDDRRFALSAGRVELKRSGEARTDLDALVFDRKTGTLGVFELKAQDPFARSVEERLRQRDNFFHANRQVSAVLEWVQRRGADDLLVRFDERAAKRFRVQKVHVFVLGRYLAHFAGGPEPDRRAAWGSWPQVLQIAEEGIIGPESRNPLGTLFARLHDALAPSVPAGAAIQEIAVGGLRLRIYPSFAAMRSAGDHPA